MYCAAFGVTSDDMTAIARGLPAITKLVPTGGNPTCCRKKMGKNLIVMPEASPNIKSAVAKMYGMILVLRLRCFLSETVPFSAIKYNVCYHLLTTAKVNKQFGLNSTYIPMWYSETQTKLESDAAGACMLSSIQQSKSCAENADLLEPCSTLMLAVQH